MNVACDFDGTLVDTGEALRLAYESVGVRWQPNEPWQSWCSPAQHAEKCRVYPDYVAKFARLTPLAVVMCTSVPVLSGASPESIFAVCSVLGLELRQVYAGLTLRGKIAHVKRLEITRYVDDDRRVLDAIHREVPTCQTYTPLGSYSRAAVVNGSPMPEFPSSRSH